MTVPSPQNTKASATKHSDEMVELLKSMGGNEDYLSTLLTDDNTPRGVKEGFLYPLNASSKEKHQKSSRPSSSEPDQKSHLAGKEKFRPILSELDQKLRSNAEPDIERKMRQNPIQKPTLPSYSFNYPPQEKKPAIPNNTSKDTKNTQMEDFLQSMGGNTDYLQTLTG